MRLDQPPAHSKRGPVVGNLTSRVYQQQADSYDLG